MKAIQQQLVENGSASVIAPGLSDAQVETLQEKFGFKFPPEVLFFLQVGVPIKHETTEGSIPAELPAFYQTASDGWHNWHLLASDELVVGSDDDTITKQIKWHATPEHQSHPADYPLIPLFAHRMIPSVPHQIGNPVFSMHGCYDNIIYGRNFWVWLEEEFRVEVNDQYKETSVSYSDIPFWHSFIN